MSSTPAPGAAEDRGDTPVPFTADDYRARMTRATESAADAGLAGVIVAPGPDLVYLTGYRPTAITERLTFLVLAVGQEPVLVVPTLEAPDAEKATGAAALTLRDWTDGKDPYAVTAPLLDVDGRFGVSDNAWAMHLLGLQKALPETRTSPSPRPCRCSAVSRTPTSWPGSRPPGPPPTGRTERSSRSVSPAAGRSTWPPTSPRC